MCRPASKFVIPCTLLAVLLTPLGVAAVPVWPGYEPVTRIVNFADLDLTDTKAVATLYARIRSAANIVCEPADARSEDTLSSVRRCTKRAIAQAVKDVNSSGLTTFHMTATNPADFQ
jgi:UrcA family protein